MEQRINRTLYRIKLTVFLVFFCNTLLAQVNHRKWISADGKYSFEQVSSNEWINRTWDISYTATVDDDGNNITLFDSKNNSYVQLTPRECLLKKNSANFEKFSSGRWQSILPNYFLDNHDRQIRSKLNCRYRETATLSVDDRNAYLAPGDNWVWYMSTGDKKILKNRGSKCNINPEENCKYMLESENDPQLGLFSVEIFVDTNTVAPNLTLDNEKRFFCTTETPKLWLKDGFLGKNAKWHLFESGKDIDSTYENYFVLNLNDPKQYSFTVCAKANGRIATRQVPISLVSTNPSQLPNNIEVSDNSPCLHKFITINLVGGHLGENASWKYSINGNIPNIMSVGNNTISIMVEKAQTIISIGVDKSCNEIVESVIEVNTVNKGLLIKDLPSYNQIIDVTPYDFKKKGDVTLGFNLPDNYKNYTYYWIDLNKNLSLGSAERLELKKINKQTNVQLTLTGHCETKSFTFKPADKWERDAIAKQNVHAENRRNQKQRRKENKDDNRTARKQKRHAKQDKKSNYVAKRKEVKKKSNVPIITGDLNVLGINNRAGQLGLGINYNFYRPSNKSFFAFGSGFGVGCGIKCYSELSWNSATFDSRSKGKTKYETMHYTFTSHIGVTYNTGVRGIDFSSDSTGSGTSGVSNKITFDYLPVVCAYAAVAIYRKDGVAWIIGYSHRLSTNSFQFSSSQPINSSDKSTIDFLSLMSPGGLMIGWTAKF